MGVSRVGDKSKRKKGGRSVGASRNAKKDGMPDGQPAGRIKKVREDDEGPAAENDEEDD
jgi:hypothetical protein